MSNSLEQFKNSYVAMQQANLNLLAKLAQSYPDLIDGPFYFSQTPWIDLDNKTLADFKALAIYQTIDKKLLPSLYPGVDFSPGKNTPIETLLAPKKLNPIQIAQAVESTKEIANIMLQESRNTITGCESILNFLKSCLNFLGTIITFGQRQNFFETTTFQLDQIKEIQDKIHMSFETLVEEEKVTELASTFNNQLVL
ncbi:hypothetical protein [Legionella cardiaca]|uniref:Uncharacterized protein n=1 Tax=Legionella cardiaca TaxID=1071983 RepID=A0ABY8AMR6_9GAMM|nr:hypothetical protein [Legionella cardiaca]WED41973.1 hypothetical protein PXX05_08490 [Legionella cardiaca]